ncbi:MAG TPA: nucleotide-binding protein [Nitrosopumilaceae archaeon]|nr:nucleotide-binding protein [Nitrosopumilaceae archaeon]
MVFRVLDASAFYAGIPFASSEKCFTTQDVFEEVKHIKRSHYAVEALLETKRLEIMRPNEEYINEVIQKSKNTGDFQNLSAEDISVIALCLQLKADLVTDDFAVSNLSKYLNLKVIPVMTEGITHIANWVYFCSGCQKTFSNLSRCPLCGNRLSRKPSKRR